MSVEQFGTGLIPFWLFLPDVIDELQNGRQFFLVVLYGRSGQRPRAERNPGFIAGAANA